MAGLRIPVYAPGVPGTGYGASALGQTGGATIAQTAYGAGEAPQKGGIEHWHIFTGVQIAGLLWLVFLRWSLPSGGKRA